MAETQGLRRLAEWASDLEKAIDHFSKMGVELRRGRIAEYANIFQRAEQADETLTMEEVNSAVAETHDLFAATKLSAAKLIAVRERLPELCKGNTVLVAGNDHDAGRDLCFELVTAAAFQENGLDSKLGAPTDVRISWHTQPAFVECKRATTLKAIGRNLKKAFRQMSEHRKAGLTGLGIVALDLSVLVNPTAETIANFDVEKSIDGLYNQLRLTLSAAGPFIARANRDSRSDARVHAILMRAKSLVVDAKGAVRVAQIWQIHPVYSLDSPEIKRLHEMVSSLDSFSA